MNDNGDTHLTLVSAASSIIWEAFGIGESPLNSISTLEMIEKLAREHLAIDDQDATIATIRDCFEVQSENQWLRTEMRGPIAIIILDGVRRYLESPDSGKSDEMMFWAVGSIEPTVAAPIFEATWSTPEINAFSERALDTLKRLSATDDVIDAKRITRIEKGKVRATVADIPRERRIDTLRRLRGTYFDLYPGVAKAVRLLVMLNSEHFYALVNGIDHPYLKVLAADEMVDRGAGDERVVSVDWIKETASDDLVRLAIVHALEAINETDSETRRETGSPLTDDDYQAATDDLIEGLVGRLTFLDPIRIVGIVFELLNDARHSLNSYGRGIGPPRYQLLRKLCGDLLVQLATANWSDELFDELRSGLDLNDLNPLTLPLAELAWELREQHPERASIIFRSVLDLLDERVERSIHIRQRPYYSLSHWQQRECILGFGVALAASLGDLDLTEWISNKCKALPLSMWDAEEDHELFSVADGAAQLLFLVAFHAIDVGNSNDIPFDPRIVRTLAELHWLHCQFVGSHTGTGIDEIHPAEFSARVAAIYGEPSGTWLLNQAKDKKVHLRAVWALFDQHSAKQRSRYNCGKFPQRLADIIVERHPDVEKLSLFDLHYLGLLWLLLGAGNNAGETAAAIIAYQPTRADRAHKILALKLLAFAANQETGNVESKPQINHLYQELWPTKFTDREELDERRAIDAFLVRSA